MNDRAAPTPLPSDPLAADAASRESKPDSLLRAIRWSSEAFRSDHPEYKAFWEWFDQRGLKDMTRTDSRELLESIPDHFDPREVPPPVRAHFARQRAGREVPDETDNSDDEKESWLANNSGWRHRKELREWVEGKRDRE